MQIITKDEYDEAIQTLADRVFDPLSDSGDVREFTYEIVDDTLDDGVDQDDVTERLRQQVFHKVLFEHPFEFDGPITDMPPVMAGCVVEADDTPRTMDRRYAEEHLSVSPRSPPRSFGEMAAGVVFSAVKSEVFDRARHAVADADSTAENPDAEAA